MPTLSRREICDNAYAFVKEWQGETRENAEAKPFWEAFFRVFGVTRRRVASFEEPLQKSDGKMGRADLLWKGKLLIEHKSAGKDLKKAYNQALNYFPGLKDQELPRYVLVSDFTTFVLYDLDRRIEHQFTLEQLPDQIHLFDFIAGFEDDESSPIQDELYELNLRATKKLGKLYDALKTSSYTEHALKIFLVRILFCLFAEDTGIFARHQFIRYLLKHTHEDGSDTDMHLVKLFQVLDTPDKNRSRHLPEDLNAFPYVNGHIFVERVDMPSFSAAMREQLIECTWFDWSTISPAIFGSLFQGVMDKQERRAGGAHYTSETNILRLIKPLFLDELQREFLVIQRAKRNRQQKLVEFQKKLSQLRFFDPACGCGNFLIVSYREVRRLELQVLQEQYGDTPDTHLALEIMPLITLNNFYGIEIDEWPARIAEVAMWLTQHQLNREFARQFGREPDLLPLRTAAHIVNDNALHLDWATVLGQPTREIMDVLFILGNPPFVGKKEQSEAQKQDLLKIFADSKSLSVLDYVTAWYIKTARFIHNTPIRAAFVSTNSITQGEQVAPLWKSLFNLGMYINFAHQTFAWQSEAPGASAVHVVIIGFSWKFHQSKTPTLYESEANENGSLNDVRRLFGYPDLKGEPIEKIAENINPYLIDAPDIIVTKRSTPLCRVPSIVFGSKAVDFGFFIFKNEAEVEEFLQKEPTAKAWIREYIGGEEFLNGSKRFCLWLRDITPDELRTMPHVVRRINQVRQKRLESKKAPTQKLADIPTLFGEDRQPNEDFLLIPKVSSERRVYVPLGFVSKEVIINPSVLVIPGAQLFDFGVLSSLMHMIWLKSVGGRLESRYQYSATLVYNNFPFPEPTTAQKTKVELAATAVLEVRTQYPKSTLADLYDPIVMPISLRKAHQKLDKAVESCYRKEKFKDDAERLSFLFARYQTLSQ